MRATTVSPGPGRYNIRGTTDCRTAPIAISSRDWGDYLDTRFLPGSSSPGPKYNFKGSTRAKEAPPGYMPTGALKCPTDEDAVDKILEDLQHWLATNKPDLMQA